jgi:hypothetical protein
MSGGLVLSASISAFLNRGLGSRIVNAIVREVKLKLNNFCYAERYYILPVLIVYVGNILCLCAKSHFFHKVYAS